MRLLTIGPGYHPHPVSCMIVFLFRFKSSPLIGQLISVIDFIQQSQCDSPHTGQCNYLCHPGIDRETLRKQNISRNNCRIQIPSVLPGGRQNLFSILAEVQSKGDVGIPTQVKHRIIKVF